MSPPILVGLLDSGVGAELEPVVAAARRFRLDGEGRLIEDAAGQDRIGHGAAIACIIAATAPQARLAVAQVFIDAVAAAPAVVARGLDWLAGEGVRLVNMSFGLRQDRAVLRRACAAANDAGLILLAAAPARGAMVYPAGYEGVVKVSGDARCAVGELSTLGGRQADFGAHPRPLEPAQGPVPVGGSSFAVAHLAGILADFLSREPTADKAAALHHLRSIARYHGPERRGVKDRST